MLQIPPALYLACHILFKVLALTATVICLQCVQILYKSPQSGNTKISEFSERNNLCSTFAKARHELLLLPSSALMCPTFIFGTAVHSGYSSSERRCVALFFFFTCPIVQHQVVLQRGFDVFRPPLSRMQICTLAWARRLHKLTACQTPPHDVFSVQLWEK